MSQSTISKLVRRHGGRLKPDIVRGVEACRKVWDFKQQGEEAFEAFCLEQYAPPGKARNELLARLDEFYQAIDGGMNVMLKVARAGQDIADRPLLPAERVFSAFTPGIHVLEDFRRFGVAAVAQLNFGTDDRTFPRTRAGWAARRLGDIGREVIPARFLADHAEAQSAVDSFISSYNLHLDRFVFADSRVRFPRGTRLVSHWGLRDYMTSLNNQKDALPRQRAILDLMRRVVDGEIPTSVLDNPTVRWDIDRDRIVEGKKQRAAVPQGALRWEHFRRVWKSIRAVDPFTRFGNIIDNKFLVAREMTEEKVVGILTEILASPLAERVSCYIRDRLGRPLEPFDIYYRDFVGGRSGKKKLRFDIRRRYPDAHSLWQAIPSILTRLGWKPDRARWIASRIRVDNGRSAGHAWPPGTEEDRQLLRVRVDRRGCDEINFETFMHELGHCVEGVLSSYEMDHGALWGVPNTAFTEGFAFTFQDQTDVVLGRGRRSVSDALTLRRFWEPFEIAGSALTEIRFFHWLYEHPGATARQMMRAIRRIGDELWGDHYARIFGSESHGLLSVYSHILWGDFYLADYPMGYVIAYQIRKHLQERSLASEMERVCALGRLYPDAWMKAAVGHEVSVQPLLHDTRRALERMGY